MLPLGPPPGPKRSSSSARTVSLTVPGSLANQVPNAFIPDILTGTVNVFDCIEDQGPSAKAFLNMCRFLDD